MKALSKIVFLFQTGQNGLFHFSLKSKSYF